MKKIRLCAVALAAALVLASCSGGGEQEKTYTDDAGNSVTESERGKTISAKALPAAVEYNGNEIQLTGVEVYDAVANYSHNLYIVVTLDASALSDEDFHWLQESDLDVSCFITHEGNEYSNDLAHPLGVLAYTDTKEIQVVRTSDFGKENRNSFIDATIGVTVKVTQGEKYEYTTSSGKTGEMNKADSLLYRYHIDQEPAPAEDIAEPLYSHIVDWLTGK